MRTSITSMPKALGLAVNLVADLLHDRGALVGDHRLQFDVADDAAQAAVDDRAEPRAHDRLGADALIEQQRIGDLKRA